MAAKLMLRIDEISGSLAKGCSICINFGSRKNKFFFLLLFKPFFMAYKGLTLLTTLCLLAFNAYTQTIIIKGNVKDPSASQVVEGLSIFLENNEISTAVDAAGDFQIEVAQEGNEILIISKDGNELARRDFTIKAPLTDLGTLLITPAASIITNDVIPTVTLSEDDFSDDDDDFQFSSLLTANRDVFLSTASFTFGIRRYRIRGLFANEYAYYINGVPINELESGRVNFSMWSGLNDVTRNGDASIGFAPTDYSFGGIAGAVHINMRAERQRKQKRFSISRTNGAYTNRLMATYSTGLLPNDWSFSLSGSRRWAEEGYVEGTFFDAWSYYASAGKKLNEQHSINLSIFGTPNERGRSGAAIQEMYDLADDNYYNPNWGYQNGEKRNARVGNTHQPIGILTHDWNLDDATSLVTAISYQAGENGSTALDWYNAADPRPDYYRRLPSYIRANSSPTIADRVEDILRNNKAARQINWDRFYEINRNSPFTVENANGQAGNTVSGNLSRYIIEDRQYDSKKANFYSKFQKIFNDQFSLDAGVSYQYFRGENYRRVNDLLGGDFYIDYDDFAERDFPGNTITRQNDLNNPDRVLQVGDKFGYNYDSDIHKAEVWLQGKWSIGKWAPFLAATVSNTRFWRTGNYRNGKFPDSSFGEGEKQTFTNYGAKGGLTYTINGRNYLYANATYRTRAPFFRHAYVSPRTRHQVVPGLKDVTQWGGEAGYELRSPDVKARLTGYYLQINDEINVISFYHDDLRTFVNYVVQNIDHRHTGIELGVEAKLMAGLKAHSAIGIGQNIFTSRPTAIVAQDNNATLLSEGEVLYLKNFHVANGPAQAYNVGLEYRPRGYWSFWLDVSYFNKNWLSVNPVRRTEGAVSLDATGTDKIAQGSQLWQDILWQTETDGFVMVDLSGRKSFKWGDYYLALNLGMNNLLNKQDHITGGYEQYRFDFEDKNVDRFPNRLFYGFGFTYYLSATLSF